MTGRALVLAAIVSALLAAGCSHEPVPQEPAGSPAIIAHPAPSLPATTTALPLMDVAGFDRLLAELRGTPVVVNVWASWCEPCKSEAPHLAEAAGEYADTVQFVGVDILDARSAATGFIDVYGIPYPSVFDPSGAIRTSLDSIGQPVTAFYDADGTLVAKVDGEISRADLNEHLAEIVG